MLLQYLMQNVTFLTRKQFRLDNLLYLLDSFYFLGKTTSLTKVVEAFFALVLLSRGKKVNGCRVVAQH